MNITASVGPLDLRTPLVAAAGTVGSVVDVAPVAAFEAYGAAVAKSVSDEPWPGREPPRVAPIATGMLNAIGIQNPGIEAWMEDVAPHLGDVGVPVWASAVGTNPGAFASVARRFEDAGVAAVEVNLSCPNLDGHGIIALDPEASRRVIREVADAVELPVGAKLSPNAQDIVGIAEAVVEAGASFLTLTNTIWGAAIDLDTMTPVLSAGKGGYSGPGLKPISLRCVLDVHRAMPTVPIVGTGGVQTGRDVVEYLLAGASAVGIGTVHFAEPKAGRRILKETVRLARRMGAATLGELIGAAA